MQTIGQDFTWINFPSLFHAAPLGHHHMLFLICTAPYMPCTPLSTPRHPSHSEFHSLSVWQLWHIPMNLSQPTQHLSHTSMFQSWSTQLHTPSFPSLYGSSHLTACRPWTCNFLLAWPLVFFPGGFPQAKKMEKPARSLESNGAKEGKR